MKTIISLLLLGTHTLIFCADLHAFAKKPTVTKCDSGYRISFSVTAPTDVAVYIESENGNVVRHLVAGMIGVPNPMPPLKPGLSQEIEWDGKADYGKSAQGGPWKVRIGLGLWAKFDKVIHSTLDELGSAASLAAGPDGTLFVAAAPLYGLATDRWRIFDRTGKFVSTWGVPPGPEALKYFEWKSENGKPDPMDFKALKYGSAAWAFTTFSGSDAIVINPNGSDLFQIGNTSPLCMYRYPLVATCPKDDKFRVNLDFGPGITPSLCGAAGLGNGLYPTGSLAISSDGSRIYLAGFVNKGKGEAPLCAVYSVLCPQRTGCKSFFGDAATSGNTDKLLGSAPSGLVTDGQGHLFIADTANNRIVVVLEKEGTYAGQIDVQSPVRIGLSRKRNTLYVLGTSGKSCFLNSVSLAAGQATSWKGLKASTSLPIENTKGFLSVDDSGPQPVVWIGGAWGPTTRIEDLGGNFGNIKKFEGQSAVGKYCLDNIPCSNVQVDRARKEIYCRVGGNGRSNLRYCENSDKKEIVEVRPRFILGGGAGLQVVPAPNGNLYSQQWETSFYQWDREGKPLDWAAKRIATADEYKVATRPGPITPEVEAELAKNGIKVNPKTVENRPPFEAFVPTGMGVLPHTLGVRWSDGHLFIIEAFRWKGNEGGRTLKALHEYLPTGSRLTNSGAPIVWKLSDAAVGPKFDAAGNIYIAEAVRPENWLMPQELSQYYSQKGISLLPIGKRGSFGTRYNDPVRAASAMYGSIIKFSPRGGMVNFNKEKGPLACGLEPFTGEPKFDASIKTIKVDIIGADGCLWTGDIAERGATVIGAEWMYPGVSHVGHFACNCENISFDVDEFGRTFFPDPLQFKVGVIDSQGHDITSFGDYGDANCVGADSAVIDPNTNKLRPRNADDPKVLICPFAKPELAFSWIIGVGVKDRYIYFGDCLNQRFLRAHLSYRAEESCPLGR